MNVITEIQDGDHLVVLPEDRVEIGLVFPVGSCWLATSYHEDTPSPRPSYRTKVAAVTSVVEAYRRRFG